MGIKEQLVTLKENWLVIVLALAVLIFISGGNGIVNQNFSGMKTMSDSFGGGYEVAESLNYYPGVDGDFAPEIEERKITRSSSLSSEIDRGEFGEAEEQLKNIISSSGAYLLNERVDKNGEGWKGYFYGSYSLKVDTDKYVAVVAQLKEIGEVEGFEESMLDVTERYDDISIEIEVEKERLERYMDMFDEAEEVGDRISLNDMIFGQERRVKYLEDSLENVDNRVDYSSISFRMTEERSKWTHIAVVGISDLVRGFVDSLNALLGLLFGVLPWAFVGWIGWVVWKRVRK